MQSSHLRRRSRCNTVPVQRGSTHKKSALSRIGELVQIAAEKRSAQVGGRFDALVHVGRWIRVSKRAVDRSHLHLHLEAEVKVRV